MTAKRPISNGANVLCWLACCVIATWSARGVNAMLYCVHRVEILKSPKESSFSKLSLPWVSEGRPSPALRVHTECSRAYTSQFVLEVKL